MRFKIRNTEVKISFSFFALILLLITTDFDKELVLVVAFAIVHEAIHLMFINIFSSAPKRVSLNLFGADILRDNNVAINHNAEILIHLSAPLFNLIIGVLIYSFNVVFFDSGLLDSCARVNLVLGVFNLIPFYNFDGGNALNNFLLKFITTKATEITITCISIIITIIFSLTSVWLVVEHKGNASLVFISGYMIFSIIFKK